MKLVQITFHFEFWQQVEQILDKHEIGHFIHIPAVQGKDTEGKHYATQVFPGSVSIVHAGLNDEDVEGLLDDLNDFRGQRSAHEHLEVFVLPVERHL